MNNQQIFDLYREAWKRTARIQASCKKIENNISKNDYNDDETKEKDLWLLLCMEEFIWD